MSKASCVAALLAVSWSQAVAAPSGTPAARLEAAEAQYPPWQQGRSNDAAKQGLVFTVPPADVMADFHGCQSAC